jgi:hypothetical protein
MILHGDAYPCDSGRRDQAVPNSHTEKIILVDSSSIRYDTMECLQVSGIKQATIDVGIDDIRISRGVET